MYKPLKKLIGKTPLGKLRVPVLGWGCDTGMTLLRLSWTMTDDIGPAAKALIDSEKPVIYAIYHGRMAGLLALPGRKRTSILISSSTDGEMVARAMIAQGFMVARGSAAHGALKAAKDMLKTLAAGKNVVVTVDGPRGPAMEVKQAVIRLAQTSHVPIIPIVADAKHVLTFKSWDSFMFPYFFTSMRCFYGEPMDLSKEDASLSTEQLQSILDGKMRELADRGAAWSQRTKSNHPVATTG